jgi:hypothetical protein
LKATTAILILWLLSSLCFLAEINESRKKIARLETFSALLLSAHQNEINEKHDLARSTK